MNLRKSFVVLIASAFFAAGGLANEQAMQSEMADRTLLLAYAQTGERIIAVGEFGNIIHTDDGGQSWQQAAAVDTRVTLTAITFINESVGFAVGHDAVILKTTDRGETWETIYQDPASETPLFDIYFENGERGIAIGAFGTILRTRDGGESWDVDLIDPSGETDYHLNAIFSDDGNTIYVAAESGTVFKSTDRGRSFRLLRTPYDGSFWGGTLLTSGRVLVWGMRGNVYYSDTNGQSWVRANTGTNRSVSDGLQLPDGKIILIGLSGLVLTSKDNGANFQETVRSDRKSYAAVSPGANGRLILYGDSGVAWQDIP